MVLTSTERPSAASLTSWSETLASTTQNPYQLSEAAVASSINITAKIVSISASDPNGASAILGVMGGVLNTLNSLYANAEANAEVSGHGRRKLFSSASSDELMNSFAAALLDSRADTEDSIFDHFRMSTADSSSGGPTDMSFSARTPVTELERLSGVNASIVTGNSTAAGGIHMVIVSKLASQFNRALSANGHTESFSSNPLAVHIAATNVSGGDGVLPSELLFTLYHNDPQVLGAMDITENVDLPTINTTCIYNQTSVNTTVCPNGAIVSHVCDGILHGVFVTPCPLQIRVSNCYLLAPTGLPEAMCTIIQQTAGSTTCSCVLPNRRRLSDSRDGGISEVAAMTTTTFDSFVNTFDSAEKFTAPADFVQVFDVMIMFGVIWIGGFGLVSFVIYREDQESLSLFHSKKIKADGFTGIGSGTQKQAQLKSPMDMKRCVLEYVEKTFPPVFVDETLDGRETSWLRRLWFEIKTKHRYVAVLSPTSSDSNNKQKLLIMLELLTTQTMLMFLLAVCYDLQGPSDDGSCVVPPVSDNKLSCLERKSIFDASQSYCVWVEREMLPGAPPAEPHEAYTCSYADNGLTIQMIAVSACVVAMFTAIFSIPIEYTFELLFAPTADELKVAHEHIAIANRMERRMSAAAATVAKTARRASALLVGTVTPNVVRREHKLNKVGSVSRLIPEHTLEAHNQASQSIEYLAPLFRRSTEHCQQTKKKVVDRANKCMPSESVAIRVTGTNMDMAIPLKQQSLLQYAELCQDIHLQRQLLRPLEVKHFDTQWSICLDEDSNLGMYNIERSKNIGDGSKLSSIEKTVLNVIYETKVSAAKEVKKLKFAQDSHIGLEIMHMFVIDLLGRDTPAAKIFAAKAEEDFTFATVVTRFVKGCLISCVLLMNMFFIYFTLLRSFERGLHFQRGFIGACVIQFVIEILLFQTIECAFVNFVVPNLIADQVRGVVRAVRQSLAVVFSKGDETSDGEGIVTNVVSRLSVLDATQYLFVATAIAKAFPDLIESHIVSAYHTYLPGELAKKWHTHNVHSTASYYYDSFVNYHAQPSHHTTSSLLTAVKFGLFNLIFGAMLFVGASPMAVQKAIIRLVQPIAASVFAVLIIGITNSLIALVCSCGFVVLLLGWTAWSRMYPTIEPSEQRSSNSVVKKSRGVGSVVPMMEHADSVNMGMSMNGDPEDIGLLAVELDLDLEEEFSHDGSSNSSSFRSSISDRAARALDAELERYDLQRCEEEEEQKEKEQEEQRLAAIREEKERALADVHRSITLVDGYQDRLQFERSERAGAQSETGGDPHGWNDGAVVVPGYVISDSDGDSSDDGYTDEPAGLQPPRSMAEQDSEESSDNGPGHDIFQCVDGLDIGDLSEWALDPLENHHQLIYSSLGSDSDSDSNSRNSCVCAPAAVAVAVAGREEPDAECMNIVENWEAEDEPYTSSSDEGGKY